MKKYIVLLLAFLMIFTSAALAADVNSIDVYVSVYGNDIDGDGTQEKPFASLEKAKKYVSGLEKTTAINVVFKEGKYRFSDNVVFNADDSGTPDAPVTYMAEKGAKVVFTGAVPVNKTMFEKVTGAEILSRLPLEARDKVVMLDLSKQGINYNSVFPILYVNDNQALIARYPNYGYDEIVPNETNSFYYDYDNVVNWASPDIQFVGNPKFGYIWETFDVKKIEENNVILSNTLTTSEDTVYFYIRNLLEELDSPGEYYIENNILYYYPEGELGDLSMELISFDKSSMISISGSKYINFDGITFEKAKSTAISVSSSNSINIKNCNFKFLIQENALKISGKNCTISDNYVYGCGGGFIKINGGSMENLEPGNIVVTRNRIIACGNWFPSSGAAIAGGVANYKLYDICIGNSVTNNIIQDCNTSSAISLNGNDNIIKYNEVINQGRIIEDGGAVYVGKSVSKYGTEIAYNYFHDFRKDNFYCTVYSDDGFSGLSVHHNVMEDVSRGMIAGVGMDNKFCNNLMINVAYGFHLGTRLSSKWPKDIFGQKGELYQEAYTVINNSNALIKDAYNTKYTEIKEGLERYSLKGYPYFAPWNTLVTGNVSIGSEKAIYSRPEHAYYSDDTYTVEDEEKVPTLSTYNSGSLVYVDEIKTYGAKLADSSGNDLNATEAGNPRFDYNDSYFKDVVSQNYTLKSSISTVSDVHSIDMTKIGIISTTNKNIFEKNYEKVSLKKPAYNNKKVTVSWENIPFSSVYEITVSKNSDLSNPVNTYTLYECFDTDRYTFNIDTEGTYYYQIKAKGLSREDMFEISSDIASFTVDSIYDDSLKNALLILNSTISDVENGIYLCNGYEETMKAVYDSVSSSEFQSQEECNEAENKIYDVLSTFENSVVMPDMEIIRFEPDKNTTTVYVEAIGFEADSLVTATVTNPDITLNQAALDMSLNTICYIDTVKANNKGHIAFEFNTSKNDIDYTGTYDIYLTNSNSETLKKSYIYGTVELSDVKFKTLDGTLVKREELATYKGTEIKLSMSVKNRTERMLTPEVYLGIYESGTLKNAFVQNQTSIPKNSDGTIEISVVIPESYIADSELKLFVWDDTELLRPLTKTRFILE